jgi:hypothetical protein
MAAVLLSMGIFSGCKTVEGLIGNINLNVEDVAPYVETAAASGVNSGLKALAKDQASFDTTKTIATEVEKHVAEAVLPLFTGADLDAVTRATADQALALVNDNTKVNPKVLGAIQLAIDSALLFLDLPDDPTAKLPDDQRKLIVALFNGVVTGLQRFQSWGGPDGGTRDLGPPVTACSWSSGGEQP